jgi:hypothetical protein
MTAPPDEDKVGYGHPPPKSRWKKGQSGNPHKKPRRPESIVEIIDRLLLSAVTFTLNGETKRGTALEAIVSQLQLKEMAGSSRASRILVDYRELANQHAEKQIQLVFVEDESLGEASRVTLETEHG